MGKISDVELLKSIYFMHSAGVPIHEAMREFGSRINDVRKADSLIMAADLMEKQGANFAGAIEQVGLFPNFVKVLKIGQDTGNLTVVMREIADAQEKIEAVGRKLKGSLYYPIILMFISIGLGLGLTFVIENLMKGFGKGLEATFAFKFADFLVRFRYFVFGGYALGLVLLIVFSIKNAYKMPVLKGFYNTFALGRAFKLFALALRSGLPLADSFIFASQTMKGAWSGIFLQMSEESKTRNINDIIDDFEDYMNPDAFLVLRSATKAGNIHIGFESIGDREIDKAFVKITTFSPLVNAIAFIYVALQIVVVMSPIYMLIFTFMDKVGGTK